MDGKTYLNYIRNRIRFKCDWKRKLFSTGYTVLSEMVATDRKENNVAIIPGKMAFHQKDAFMIKWMNIGARIFGAPIISLNLRNHWKMQSIS